MMINRTYGALAAYVARHALAVAGPVREFYPLNRHHNADPTRWGTEIGWPIFPTELITAAHNAREEELTLELSDCRWALVQAGWLALSSLGGETGAKVAATSR